MVCITNYDKDKYLISDALGKSGGSCYAKVGKNIHMLHRKITLTNKLNLTGLN